MGGFNIDGRTREFDTGLPDPGIKPTHWVNADQSAPDVVVDGKLADFTPTLKKTLAQYIGSLTANASVDYPVDGSTSKVASIETSAGFPALQTPTAPAIPINVSEFAADTKGTLDVNLSSLSTSFAKLGAAFRKGRANPTTKQFDGNDLLASVVGNASYTSTTKTFTSDPNLTSDAVSNAVAVAGHLDHNKSINYGVASYTKSVLGNNRFTDASNAFSIAKTDAMGFNPELTQQLILGAYESTAATVSMGRLASIGPLLTLRASQVLGAGNSGVDPNDAGTQLAALLPSPNQLGVALIDQNSLTAGDILNGLTNDDITDSSFVLSFGGSWGQLNNADDPYYGTDALGMVVLSVALVAVMALSFDLLSVILGLITPTLNAPARDGLGRYSLGEYIPGTKKANQNNAGGIGGIVSAASSLNFGSMLGIQPTDFPFQKALESGMDAFFQLPQPSGGILSQVGSQLLGAVTSAIDSPGFNSIVARTIIRSGAIIVNQIKKIGGNPMNAITQILALIDVLRSSKIIAACNIFATLGDAILTEDTNNQDPQDATRVSLSDALPNDATNVEVGKSRLQNSLKLAWASNRAPANILLPDTIVGTAYVVNNLDQFNAFIGTQEDSLSNVQSTMTTDTDSGRISNTIAQQYEVQLESSYVPFYFHDMRTNEMISFHAFLTSLTDDYTASYEKTEGLGRAEPIRTYRGTERRINMSFYIAATSLLDFDEM